VTEARAAVDATSVVRISEAVREKNFISIAG